MPCRSGHQDRRGHLGRETGGGAARRGSDARGGVTANWRGVVYPHDLPREEVVRVLHAAVRHGRAEQHLLPAAVPVNRPALGRTGACGASRYAIKLGQFGSHRKKLSDPDSLAAQPPRPGRPPRRGPRKVPLWRNCHRTGTATPTGSTSSSRTQPDGLSGGRSRCGSRRWLHDDVFDVLHRHGVALCIHDLIDDHPFDPHDGLDVRPIPRSRGDDRSLPGPLRAGSAGAARRAVVRRARRRRRRVRLLQQRLRRPRGRRRAMAAPRDRSRIALGMIGRAAAVCTTPPCLHHPVLGYRGGYPARGTVTNGGRTVVNDPMRILKADHREVEQLLDKLAGIGRRRGTGEDGR